MQINKIVGTEETTTDCNFKLAACLSVCLFRLLYVTTGPILAGLSLFDEAAADGLML